MSAFKSGHSSVLVQGVKRRARPSEGHVAVIENPSKSTSTLSILKAAAFDIPPVGSKPTHEKQYDEDDQNDADDTDAAVTEAVAVAAEATTEATKQEDDENDDEYESNGHGLSPVSAPNRTLSLFDLDRNFPLLLLDGNTALPDVIAVPVSGPLCPPMGKPRHERPGLTQLLAIAASDPHINGCGASHLR
jgi:hypothetical protein